MRRILRLLLLTAPALLALATLGTVAADDHCAQAEVSLQVLGSGGPEFDGERASSSYLVRRRGQAVILVDAGSGSKLRFAQSGADFNTIQAVLFSHFHVDHSADFPAYIKSAFFSDRDRTLHVYGPQGNAYMPSAREFVQALLGAKDSAYPYLSRYLDDGDDYRIAVDEVRIDSRAPQALPPLDGMKLSAVAVHHGALPALAWRIDVDGKSIVFSGDMNGDYNTLAALAAHADLLVAHNAIAEDETGVARNLHMPPSVIADIANRAGVGKLILSHRMQRALAAERQTLNIIQGKFAKPVLLARDLDCYIP